MSEKRILGIARIDPTKCVGCGACMQNCPAQAIRMMPGWKCKVDQELCLGCGLCVRLCHRSAPEIGS